MGARRMALTTITLRLLKEVGAAAVLLVARSFEMELFT